MMNKLFNYISKVGMLAIVALMLLPFSVYASATSTATSTPLHPDTSVRGVCLRVTSLEDSFKQKISLAGRSYAKAANDRTLKLRTQATTRTADDITARKEADARFALYISTLHMNAGGDGAKNAAIDAFEKTVTEATTKRRDTLDAAQKTFMDGVQALSNTRTQEVAEEALSFQNDISAALAGAKSACDSGADPKDVRLNLHKTLAEIDLQYKGIFADQSRFMQDLDTLTGARKDAFIAAAADFAATLDAASQTLSGVVH